MFQKRHNINIISLLLTAFVSGIYFFKYSSIYLRYPFFLTAIYLFIFISTAYALGKIKNENLLILNRKLLIAFSIFILAAAFLWITFLPRFGQIGRLPAIQDWLDRFFSGRFPYNSPYTPSGYPFLFFLSMPFYFIGNIGYLEVAGLILFLYFLFHLPKGGKEILTALIILLMTPVFYYGIIVRDELFFNMMVPITSIFIAEKFLDPEKVNLKFILIGILFGLALSTRSVVAIIYAIYLPYLFRTNILKGMVFLLIIFSVFILLLIPFVIWDEKSFMHNGPIAIQSYLSHIPFWSAALFILISAAAGWIISDRQEIFFACGIFLFVPVFLSMLVQISQVGFYRAFIGDVFDPSYYIFCIPFFLFSINNYKVDNTLGKILVE